MKTRTASGFTLIELLVVIAIIAVLATLAVPTINNALARGQMTGTMSNARELHRAGFVMATDGTTSSDPNLKWPGDFDSLQTLEDYCEKLVQNDYLKAGDLQKILTAPGANAVVNSQAGDPPTVGLSGKSALKVYKVCESDPSNTIFAASANFTYGQPLSASAAPYGDKGFIIIRKGGDAGIYRKNQALPSNFGDMQAYQNAIGVLPTPEGSQEPPTAETSAMVLSNPQ